MSRRWGDLWHNGDFLKLWTGETISLFGSQVTAIALPLTAVILLEATPAQMGLLNAAGFAPFLLIALFAGIWVDRRRRRPILIVANLARALLLGLIPLLAVTGRLHIGALVAISFMVSIFSVLFDLAYQSFLPTVVLRRHLLEGNTKLQTSASVAQIGGPGLAGVLVHLFSAPFAIVLDALSFLLSALLLSLIRTPEEPPAPGEGRRRLAHEMKEGLHAVYGNPYLRAIAAEAAIYNASWNIIATVYMLYAVNELGLTPGIIGLVFMVGSVGSLLGSVLAGRAGRDLGPGPAILGAMVIACLAQSLLPFAGGPPLRASIILGAAAFLGGVGVAVSNIHVVSLRQTLVPDRLLGRTNASYRFLIYGSIPVGSLIGGFLGEQIGLRPTLLVGAAVMAFAWLPVWFSPVRSLRETPAAAEA